ncbi:MAG: hypothetical protein ABIK28_20110 [Planctomycetota bacterium]
MLHVPYFPKSRTGKPVIVVFSRSFTLPDPSLHLIFRSGCRQNLFYSNAFDGLNLTLYYEKKRCIDQIQECDQSHQAMAGTETGSGSPPGRILVSRVTADGYFY